MKRNMLLKKVSVLTLCIALAGCQGFMPGSGPLESTVVSGGVQVVQAADKLNYAVVQLSPKVIDTLKRRGAPMSFASFNDRRPSPEINPSVGDVLGITVFEAAAGGLFIPAEAGVRPGNYVQLPNVTVGKDGFVSIPYAGQIKVLGRTLAQVQEDIASKIRNRAIEPQVIVTIATQNSSFVVVTGDVNATQRYPLPPTGERILDAIARAGGPKSVGYNEWVTLKRGDRKGTIHFLSLLSNDANNIYVQPGDMIYLQAQPRTFVVVGATGQNGQFNFEIENMSMTEGLARAGGMLDSQSNPGATFLSRLEDRDTLREIGVDVAAWPEDQKKIPVIYHANFNNGGEYLLATQVPMKDKDVLYVSNALSVEITKVLQFVRIVGATGSEVTNTKNTIRNGW